MSEIDINKPMNSPFRYAGGKFYARKLIAEHLIDTDVYCEPFAGGASVFFYKTKSRINILNDLDEDIMLVYEIIRDSVDEMIELLSTFKEPSKEAHSYYKNEYKPTNELEQAVRWYYLNRISYSGIMKFENMYFGYGDKYSMRPENWPRQLLKNSAKLQGVELSSRTAIDIIDNLPNNSLAFVDPPYFNADQDKFYTKYLSRQDHLDLVECIRRNKDRLKFFITYDNCDEIRELYSFMTNIYDKEWNYCISRTDDQKQGKKLADGYQGTRKQGKELFILNY